MNAIPRKYLCCFPIAAMALSIAGCHSDNPSNSPATLAKRQTTAKLKAGMTQQEVTAALGAPTDFRSGNGKRDDVAVYKLEGQTYTIYFFQNKLTRFVASKQPVNR